MDVANLFICVIFFNFCTFSTQKEDFRGRRSSDHLHRRKRNFADLISGSVQKDPLHRVKRQSASDCGGNFTGMSGTFNFTKEIVSDCSFRIIVPVDYIVTADFSQPDGWKDSKTRVKIYEGKGGKFLGSLSSGLYNFSGKAFNSSSQRMLVSFNRSVVGTSLIYVRYTAVKAAPIVEALERVVITSESKDLTLGCKVESPLSPLQEVTWEMINDNCTIYPIKINGSKYEKSETNGSYSLLIKNVSIFDQGVYKCHAENKAGAGVSSPINVTISVYTKPNVISLDSVEVYYGESVTLFCLSTSEPQVPVKSMFWQKKVPGGRQTIGKIKEFNPPTRNDSLHQANVSVVINNVMRSDEGAYYCSASNLKGMNTVKVMLSVNDRNECENETLNTCPQICENTFGSFICKCWPGYNGDGRNCQIDYKQLGTTLKSFMIRVTVTGAGIWNTSLEDEDSAYYKDFTRNFKAAVDDSLRQMPGYRETRIISLSQGSVIIYSGVFADNTASPFIIYDSLTNSTNLNNSMPGTVVIESPLEGLGVISNVNIKNRSISVHEGTDVEIECEAKAFSVTGSLDFYWKLNEAHIRPTRVSRIQTSYKKESSTKYISTLRISDFMQSDEGNFTCNANLTDNRQNDSVAIMIYRYTLGSSSMAVLNGTNVSATCTLYPRYELANNTLKFCIDGKSVEDQRINFIGNVAVLEMTSLTRETSISCGWIRDNSCSQHKELKIEVFNPKYIRCSVQTDERNMTWPETFPGLTATANCPPGYIGMVSRECKKHGYNGTWIEPSYIDCTREKIAEVEKKLNRIKDGVEIDELVNVIREFKNESKTISQTNVTASDVRSSVKVLAAVSDIVTNRDVDITEEETSEFFAATDVVLAGDSADSWQNLYEETGVNSAALMMDIVSNVSDTILQSLPVDRPISVVGENIVLQIENVNISSIAFPKNKSSDIKSEVFFSKETVENSLNVTDSVKYSAAYYKTLGKFFHQGLTKEEIGSPILAFSIPGGDILKKLDPPVQMKFETKETNLTERQCSYWDANLPNGGGWAGYGCQASFVNETFTECKCDHLTNFAVLISVKGIAKKHHDIMSTLSLVGFVISMVCLVATIFIYVLSWRQMHSDKAVILMLMCVILILSYFTYIFGVEKTENKDVCTGVAVALHYLFLVVLFLMASEGIIHAVLVVAVFPQRQSINRYLIPISFGVPLLIVVISGSITQLKGYGTKKFCWLSTDSGLIYSFFGPCAAVVLVNIVITCLLLKKLFSTRATMNKTKKEKIKTGIRSVMILAPVFGLTWLFGLFSFHENTVVFAYLFVICNSLQGALIFLMHTFMNQTVKKDISRRMSKFRRERDVKTTMTSENSTTGTWNVFKKLRPKVLTETKSTVDESSFCNPSYGITKAEESSAFPDNKEKPGNILATTKSESSASSNIFKKIKNKMTSGAKPKNDNEQSIIYNPTYGLMKHEDSSIMTK